MSLRSRASWAATGALLVWGGCAGDPRVVQPHEVGTALLESVPGEERPAVQASVHRLEAAADSVPETEQRALSSLYRSAIADEHLSDDERVLLTKLLHELASTQPSP